MRFEAIVKGLFLFLFLMTSLTIGGWSQVTVTLTDEEGKTTIPVKPGKEIWIVFTVNIPEGEEILSGQFTLVYDPEILSCKEITPGELLAGYTTPSDAGAEGDVTPYFIGNIQKDDQGNETGRVSIAFAGVDPLPSGDGELVKAMFISKEAESFNEEGETAQIGIEDALFNEDIHPEVNGATLEYQPPEGMTWSLGITVTSDDQSVEPSQLKLGVSPDGSDGFDPGLDEAAPPEPPAAVVLYAYFPISDPDFPWVTALKTDVREVFQNAKSWDFIVKSPGNGFTLSWDISEVPQEFGSILLKYGDQAVDMRSESSAHFDAVAQQTFTVQISSVSEVEIPLSPGWNMISIPGEPVNADPSSLQTDNVLLPMYTWNPDTFTYVQVDQLEAGKGYWILALAQETLRVQVNPLTSLTVHLKPGWNMVGSVFGGSWNATDPQDAPGGMVLPPVYWYNPSSFAYEQKDAVDPGKGVWVLALGECDLTLSAPAAPKLMAEVKPGTDVWEFPVVIEWPKVSQTLILGLSERGTPRFDLNLDLALPPKPMGTDVYAYIALKDKLIDRLYRDVRSSSSENVWTIKLDGGESALLRWNLRDNPYGVFLLEDGIETINMKEIGSHKIEGDTFRIRYIPYAIWRQMIPDKTALLPNYPNPFNPETWIPFQLSEDADVMIRIYDMSGRLVRELKMGHLKAGYYRSRERAAYWDGRNEQGERVASGVYIYQMIANDKRFARRMVILK